MLSEVECVKIIIMRSEIKVSEHVTVRFFNYNTKPTEEKILSVFASVQGFSSHDIQCIMPWPCTPCLLLLLMGKKVQGEMVEGDLLGSHTQTIIFQCPYFPG